MKQISSILNLAMACVLVALIVVIGLPNAGVQAASTPQASKTLQPIPTAPEEPVEVCNTGRSIQVSGTAVVNVIPDRVLIQLGIQSNGSTPQKVEAVNSATINRIITALKKQGIQQKDIVTDWYIIRPVYDSYDSLHIKGYRIDNMLAVTLRDISKVNAVLTSALEAGANQVINVEFYLSDLRKYRDQARELAMIAAKEKAQDLAAAAGAETSCVMSINENTWSYYNGGGWWYGNSRDSNLWTQNTVQNAAPAGGGEGALTETGPVTLGQISVKAEVGASYSLK